MSRIRTRALALFLGSLLVSAAAAAASPASAVLCNQKQVDADFLGGAGDDFLTGGPNPNVGDGAGGDDTLEGLGDADTICGSGGKDTLLGDRYTSGTNYGSDDLFGGDGCDELEGNQLVDHLDGEGGDDLAPIHGGCQHGSPLFEPGGLFGGQGNDDIFGGPGDDSLTGNEGSDDVGHGNSGVDYCDLQTLETGLSCEHWV